MRAIVTAMLSLAVVLVHCCCGAAAEQPRSAGHQISRPEAQCRFAPIDPAHVFVAAGVSRGDTLTSLQLEDPNGTSTVVRIKVTEGAQRLTVVLQSHDPVIWDFEGSVHRVARAIVMSAYGNLRVAVRGLSSDVAEFPDTSRCSRDTSAPSNMSQEQRDRIMANLFGRPPDRMVFEEQPNSLALPETSFVLTPKDRPQGIVIVRKGRDGRNVRSVREVSPSGQTVERMIADRRTDAESDLYLYYPGGFREIEANSLVSPVPVLAPETFPGEAGLIQLESAGAIRPIRRSEIDEFAEGISAPYRSNLSPNYRMRVNLDYAVTRGIMLPAGLFGAHSKSFLVLSGVPTPRGFVGHGCLAFMDGYRMNESSCSGEMREPIERLRKMPPTSRLEACKQLDIPAGAALEAVSVYEPDGAKHSGGSKRVPAPIDVRVRKPGRVVLVLNTYEPAIWRVSFSAETEIAGVVLTGYYASSVDGIHPDTPVVTADWEGRGKRPKPSAECAMFFDYLGTAFRGGPAAMVIDRQTEALTGRSLDGLRGAYKSKEVEIR